MKNPETLFNSLLEIITAAQPKGDINTVKRAYEYAKAAHEGQKRVSGEDYICHPLEVAEIITVMLLDCDTIAAGILHDVLEDTDATHEDIVQNFGTEIADMVEGVTKLGKINFLSQEEAQVENLRKMFMATAKDLRVILIKLADRLHNMRTIEVMPDHKRRQKSKETIEVFAPIAHRLGMFRIKVELEDLSLKYLDPVSFEEIGKALDEKARNNHDYVDKIISSVSTALAEVDIHGKINGRVKHPYSIYKKTYMQGRTLDEIYDIFAVRVIVDTVRECYAVLGAIHDLYKPIPGRIKDYIAMPKPNMYQSLHTTVIGKDGIPFEIQIRTAEMHKIAEYGIAAHWKYKEGMSGTEKDETKFTWLRQMLELQGDITDEEEFMRVFKTDMFADSVFVFTPNGDVISLPAGSCPIDFAYAIHSAIGSQMMGAKVNGRLVPLYYKLQNGDIVQIMTSSSVHGPSRDWLKLVKTSSARTKINQWFKRERRDENIVRGKDLFEKEIKKSGYSYHQLYNESIMKKEIERHTFQTLDDLYAAIGYGAVPVKSIVNKLREEYRRNMETTLNTDSDNAHKYHTSSNGIIVEGIENCLVRLSRCCSPVPGDEIIGYITRGRGVSVHRTDCINVKNNFIGQGESDRLIQVRWEQSQQSASYMAELTVIADDRNGLLIDLMNVLSNLKISAHNLNAHTGKDFDATITIMVEIHSSKQLEEVIRKMMGVAGVVSVSRTMQ